MLFANIAFICRLILPWKPPFFGCVHIPILVLILAVIEHHFWAIKNSCEHKIFVLSCLLSSNAHSLVDKVVSLDLMVLFGEDQMLFVASSLQFNCIFNVNVFVHLGLVALGHYVRKVIGVCCCLVNDVGMLLIKNPFFHSEYLN
jgi:hypothetical protein